MRLMIVGDTHGDITHCEYVADIAKKEDCFTIFQLGDFGLGFGKTFTTAVSKLAQATGIPWVVHLGNHDNYAIVRDFPQDEMTEIAVGLRIVPRGFCWRWGDTNFLSLGGAFSIDRRYRELGISWWKEELIVEEDVEHAIRSAAAFGKIDVMLTHEVPHVAFPYEGDAMAIPASLAQRKLLSKVYLAVQPPLLVHGHWHYRYEANYQFPDTTGTVVGLDCNADQGESWMIIDV